MKKTDVVQQRKAHMCALNVGGFVACIVAVLTVVWSPDAIAAVEYTIEAPNGVGNVAATPATRSTTDGAPSGKGTFCASCALYSAAVPPKVRSTSA